MSNRSRILLLIFSMTFVIVYLPHSNSAESSKFESIYGIGSTNYQPLTSSSCSSSSCHGNGQIGKPGSEYSGWAPDLLAEESPQDPHSRAFRILFNDQSVRIAKSLGLPNAHEAQRCLVCHSIEGMKSDIAITEGVGCSACHGRAEKWVSKHYLSEWKSFTNSEKWEKFGFLPTKNLTARLSNCARCHIGDGSRDVNHDLIAAGHPRLLFESTTFHSQPSYRKHWTESLPQEDFDVRAWIIGQVVNLRATTALLVTRAEKAETDLPESVWPEYAGYSCTSCHRSLFPNDQQTKSLPSRKLETSGWEKWSTSAIEIAAEFSPEAFPGCPKPDLSSVHQLQIWMSRPTKPQQARAKAKVALADLNAWLVQLQQAEDQFHKVLSPDVKHRLLNRLAAHALSADQKSLKEENVDFLIAHILGCRTLVRSEDDKNNPRLIQASDRLFELLQYPTPRRGQSLLNPKKLTPKTINQVRGEFRNLFEASIFSRTK